MRLRRGCTRRLALHNSSQGPACRCHRNTLPPSLPPPRTQPFPQPLLPCFSPLQLVEVINEDYADYVGLSGRLANVEGAVVRMRKPLLELRVSALSSSAAELQGLRSGWRRIQRGGGLRGEGARPGKLSRTSYSRRARVGELGRKQGQYGMP